MAKLHFFYSTMNAGKSTSLLQSNHNYLESNLKTLLFLPEEISKKSDSNIVSRIGLKAKAISINTVLIVPRVANFSSFTTKFMILLVLKLFQGKLVA